MNADTRGDGTGLRVFSVNGVKEVLSGLADDFRAGTGERIAFTFGTIGALQDRMASGDLPDVLVAMAPAIARAEERGLLAEGVAVEVGRTGLAAVVREGRALPDISSVEAFRHALLQSASLAYTDPRTGAASGIAVAAILDQLGIAADLQARIVLVDGGPVGEVVAAGRADIGIQQLTELLPVKGIAFLASFPRELQRETVYRAAALRGSGQPRTAARFLEFVTSARIRQRFADAGFG